LSIWIELKDLYSKLFLFQNPHLTQSEPGKINPRCAPPTCAKKPLRVRETHSNTVHKRHPHHSACY